MKVCGRIEYQTYSTCLPTDDILDDAWRVCASGIVAYIRRQAYVCTVCTMYDRYGRIGKCKVRVWDVYSTYTRKVCTDQDHIDVPIKWLSMPENKVASRGAFAFRLTINRAGAGGWGPRITRLLGSREWSRVMTHVPHSGHRRLIPSLESSRDVERWKAWPRKRAGGSLAADLAPSRYITQVLALPYKISVMGHRWSALPKKKKKKSSTFARNYVLTTPRVSNRAPCRFISYLPYRP